MSESRGSGDMLLKEFFGVNVLTFMFTVSMNYYEISIHETFPYISLRALGKNLGGETIANPGGP